MRAKARDLLLVTETRMTDAVWYADKEFKRDAVASGKDRQAWRVRRAVP